MSKRITCCSILGCGSMGQIQNGVEYFPKGYCVKHYTRFSRHGDPLIVLKVQNTGGTKHPLYKTWANIKDRTSNPNAPKYPNYGGRGIKMCDRWQGPYGFDNFVADMGERPENNSLDRKDNNGDYCKENCRWATHHQQNANQRSNNEIVGVGWHKVTSKWQARIKADGNNKYLGNFTNYEEAVSARKSAEILHNIVSGTGG